MAEDPALPAADPSEIKACCAALYQQSWVRMLLGGSYHPGGPGMTRRLAEAVGFKPRMRVLDLASGTGETALMLAGEYGADVTGIDRSGALVDHAKRRSLDAHLGDAVRFVAGDAEALPFASDSFDIVICECALCTFPDKATAALEAARVLKPGGRIAISDMIVEHPIPGYDLANLTAWISCLGGAGTMTDYSHLLEAAGLQVRCAEEHREALVELIDRIEPRLLAAAILRFPAFPLPDTAEIKKWIMVARQAVASGAVGYCLLTGQKSDLRASPGSQEFSQAQNIRGSVVDAHL